MARRKKWEWELLPIDGDGDVIDPQHADTLAGMAKIDWRFLYPNARAVVVGVYPWRFHIVDGEELDASKDESVFLGPEGFMEAGDDWIMPTDKNPDLPKHITRQVTPELLAQIFT